MEKTRVTRKGQATIPSAFRQKYGIKEGTTMIVEDVGGAIVMMPLVGVEQLVGLDSKRYDVRKMKKEIDRLRARWR